MPHPREFILGVFIPRFMGVSQQVLQGVYTYAMKKEHWRVLLCPNIQLATTAVQQWKMDGVLFYGDDLWRNLLEPMNVPMVNVHHDVSKTHAFNVFVDSEQIGRMAAGHFLERRFVNFAYLGYEDILFSACREKGFRDALAQAGYTPSVYRQNLNQFQQPHDIQMEKWLALLPKPLGLFLSNDALVHQSLLACQNIGLAVPSDVAILGVDNLEIECDLVRPSLSSIIHPSQQIGQAAAKLIDQLMQGKKPHQRTYLIPSPGIASRTSTDVYQYGDQDVGDAMRFIREQAHQPITVQEILAKVPISRSRLERRFQEILGTTPLRQIQIAHIDRAKILLTHTDLPLSTIAERCGMRYSSQLSQLFKKITGMTPKTYRIQQRQIEF